MYIKNPILPGFNPDPSIIRVDDDYFIAVSTFEWLPGIRIYHSKDLVNFDHYTDVLTKIDLQGNPLKCSIYAPQLSYKNGIYYMLYTDVKSVKRPFKDLYNYLIYTNDLKGEWSEPVYINSSGFDPSLFHDEDGKSYILNMHWDYRLPEMMKTDGIIIQEFDLKKMKLVNDYVNIFKGSSAGKTEGPHIYKINGYYYLFTAEGGTSENHQVTVCRSKNIFGPYEEAPNNPLLTSKNNKDLYLQCSGHASLVVTQDNEYYITHLSTRPVDGKYAILGRETSIQKVIINKDGWFELEQGGNEPYNFVHKPQRFKDVKQIIMNSFFDSFEGDTIDKRWNSLRHQIDDSWATQKEKKGTLRLYGMESLQSLFKQSLLAIRQTDFDFIVETKFHFNPKNFMHMAGLVFFFNDENHLYLYVSRNDAKKRNIMLLKKENDKFEISDLGEIGENVDVELKAIVENSYANLYCNSKLVKEKVDLRFLCGSFTGNCIGICCQSLDIYKRVYADFKYFSYKTSF